jgi:predicted lipoprotein with Yx(FWY)xxD motif
MKPLFARALTPLVLGTVLTGAPAAAQPSPPAAIQGQGTAAKLIDPKARPLYFYDEDQRGQSTCYNACAASWPPLKAPHDAKPTGHWTVVTRHDGSRQWAYGGKPVYYWKNDVTGGSHAAVPISKYWHVAKP